MLRGVDRDKDQTYFLASVVRDVPGNSQHDMEVNKMYCIRPWNFLQAPCDIFAFVLFLVY